MQQPLDGEDCDDGNGATVDDFCDQDGCTGLPDPDGDGVANSGYDLVGTCTNGQMEGCNDNCPDDPNPDQADADGNGVGDVCYVLKCGGIVCPELAGYENHCNAKDHCEYANEDSTGWKKWDVWVYVPPGTFQMGSPGGEKDAQVDEDPVHTVTISYGYFIGKYEIVVEQYEACEASNPVKCTIPDTGLWSALGWGANKSTDCPSPVSERSDHPQNGLSWQQSRDFCSWVAPGGRLPSEAEWEYAAAGPVHTVYPWGDTPVPSCSNSTGVYDDGNPGERPWGCDACVEEGCSGTKPVGSMLAGASWNGALDMGGNVWEWCEDFYHFNYDNAPVDGTAWLDNPPGQHRVLRGGSFMNKGHRMRSAHREPEVADPKYANIGGRCLRPLP